MSVRLPKKTAPASPQRNEGTWLAMVLVLACIGGILSLISMVMPDIMGLLVVLGAFCGFVALHYFTWGRWLIRSTDQSLQQPFHEQPRSLPVPPAENSLDDLE